MTVVNPKSISGINSITTGSGSDDILTIHNNNGTERLRVDSTGATKIVTGIVTTLTATTGIVTTLTSNTTTLNSTTTATGNINVSGANITLQDSTSGTDDRITFGASTDFEIFHNGTNNYIDCHTAGQDLYIRPTKDVYIQDYDTDDKHIKMVKDGAVELYHNNSKKFETYANGCTVTGNLNAGNVDLTDSAKARFGASNDLQIYHDGTDNYLESTGKLYIKSSNFVDIRSSGNETMIKATPNGAVELYQDNNKKFSTTSQGAAIGQVSTIPSMDSFSCQIQAGNSGFLGNYHSGSNQQFIIGLNQYYQGGYKAPDNNVSQQLQLYNKQFNFLTAAAPGSDNGAVTNTKQLTIDDDGVKFGTDTAAANALDDYEEGTWTPQMHDGSVSVLSANYTKIGRQVTVVARLYNFSDTSTNDTLRIKNLPFAANVTSVAAGSVMYSYGSQQHATVLYLDAAHNGSFNMYGGHSGAFDNLRHNELNASGQVTDMYIIATYFTAS